MDKLVRFVDTIQDICVQHGIKNETQLPIITVVGAQSSGKSSVLEAIVGSDILPRGEGIVTRTPISIRMIHSPKITTAYTVLTEAPNYEKQKLVKPEDVRNAILHETERLAGKSGVSLQTINLEHYSKDVLDLTVIDLPGIIKNALKGQDKDLPMQITNLIQQVIMEKNVIVLAITPANTDLATSDGLNLARVFDENGNRTIGIITKCDRVEKGSDIRKSIDPNKCRLNLGYAAVICRNQEDINSKKSFVDKKKEEMAFFAENQQFKNLFQYLGIEALSSALNEILKQKILESLPKVKENFNTKRKDLDEELTKMGPFVNIMDNAMSRRRHIVDLTNKFIQGYINAIEGKSTDILSKESIKNSNLISGVARVRHLLIERFTLEINEKDDLKSITDEMLRRDSKQIAGLNPSIFIEEGVFLQITKKLIVEYEEPCLRANDIIFAELQKITLNICIPEIEKYRNLKCFLVESMLTGLKELKAPVDELIKEMIAWEKGYINTSHPDFNREAISEESPSQAPKQPPVPSEADKGKRKAVEKPPPANGYISGGAGKIKGLVSGLFGFSGKPEEVPVALELGKDFSQREQMQVDNTKMWIRAYMAIVKKNLGDAIPKIIISKIIEKGKEYLRTKLTMELPLEDEEIQKLLEHDQTLLRKRESLLNQLRAVEECLTKVAELEKELKRIEKNI